MTDTQNNGPAVETLKTAKDFYDFFAAIPEAMWCTGDFNNGRAQYCAGGHLGMRAGACSELAPYQRLNAILGGRGNTVSINDAYPELCNVAHAGAPANPYRELPTPKQRILAALQDAIAQGK